MLCRCNENTSYSVKLITHQEPIEGMQVWILLGYPSNILGYPTKYLVITIPRGN